MHLKERAFCQGEFLLEKFADGQAVRENRPYIRIVIFNIFVTVGLVEVWSLITAQGGTAYSAANANLAVGDSAAAPAVGQVALQGANQARAPMNPGFPNAPVGGVEVWQADFGPLVANFDWNEFAVFNAPIGGTMMDRAVSAQGVKIAGQTWRLTFTFTLS